MNQQSIRVENLVKTFGKGDTVVNVIDGADFSINSGELIALIAPSGAGKTTLLMMIGCVEEPTSGTMWLGDEKVYENKWLNKDTRTIRREKMDLFFKPTI